MILFVLAFSREEGPLEVWRERPENILGILIELRSRPPDGLKRTSWGPRDVRHDICSITFLSQSMVTRTKPMVCVLGAFIRQIIGRFGDQ